MNEEIRIVQSIVGQTDDDHEDDDDHDDDLTIMMMIKRDRIDFFTPDAFAEGALLWARRIPGGSPGSS